MNPEDGGGGGGGGIHASWLGSSLAWGLLWAPLLGVWAVIPHFLRTQRVHPASVEEWWLLDAVLLAVFVIFGVIGSLVTWVLLRLWTGLRSRTLSDPGWACALCVPVCLPILYFLTAACTELAIFSSLVGLARYQRFLWTAGAVYAFVCALFLFLYGAVVRQTPRPRLTPLTLGSVLALVVGLALAPVWGEPTFAPKAGTQQLRSSRNTARPAPPLLFVGVDSGSWKILQPLLDSGRAPSFRRLIESGVRGEMRAGWRHPIWSAPAWAAILTGYPREQTGIYQELAASASGLPVFQIPLEFDFLLDPLYLVEYQVAARSGYLQLAPFPRSALLRQPIWQLLHRAGVRVGVVRFGFTFPARDQADFVISDYVGEDAWKLVGARTQLTGSVAPEDMSSSLLSPFSGPSRSANALVSAALPKEGPAAASDTRVVAADALRIAANIDAQTIDASLDLLHRQPDIAAFFVYLGGFDTMCHAFWRYRFPEDFPENPPDRAAAKEFGPAIDRYLESIDGWLGRLIDSYPEAPNVLVVADHGAEALHGNRSYSGAHSPTDGIFVASGPSIPHRKDSIHITYFDVTPSILELMGFSPLPDMPGASVFGAAAEAASTNEHRYGRSSKNG